MSSSSTWAAHAKSHDKTIHMNFHHSQKLKRKDWFPEICLLEPIQFQSVGQSEISNGDADVGVSI